MASHHTWSLPLGHAGRTPIRLHLSFLLLAALVAFEASGSASTFLPEVSFVIGLFIAVALHEAAHIITALRLGVGTRESILYPFGGVSSLAKEVGPRIELAIACAGPLANALVALLLVPLAEPITDPEQFVKSSFMTKLFASNLILVAFNLIPAFPLDGGRILRSILTMIPSKDPTRTVVRISQAVSIGLGILALLSMNVLLIVIAAVMFGSAVREMVRAQALAVGQHVQISAAMIDTSKLVIFGHGTSIPDAVTRAVRSFQTIFPITRPGGDVLGYVTRDDLLHAATKGQEQGYVGSIAHQHIIQFPSDTFASEVSERMNQAGEDVAFVMEDGTLKGLITLEKLTEFLLLHSVRDNLEASKTLDDDASFF